MNHENQIFIFQPAKIRKSFLLMLKQRNFDDLKLRMPAKRIRSQGFGARCKQEKLRRAQRGYWPQVGLYSLMLLPQNIN